MAAVAYYYAGSTPSSFALIPYILPSIVLGVPLGGYLIQRIRPEVFRRVCMSFDAWVVAYGLSALLKELGLVPTNAAYLLLTGVALLDLVLLYRFFAVQVPLLKEAEALARSGVSAPGTAPGSAPVSAPAEPPLPSLNS
jgi:hypothetical protein